MNTEKISTAHQAVIESEARLLRAQRIAHMGNWVWDIPANVVHWSDEIYNIFGLGVREFKESYEAFLERVHPEDREKVKAAVQNAVDTGHTYSVFHRIIRPDGEERVVHEIGEVLLDDDGNPIRMDGTVQDITEPWNKRINLNEDSVEDEHFEKMQFWSNVEGDLKSSLSDIIRLGELIKNNQQAESGSSETAEYADKIIDNGQHVIFMLNSLLEKSILELGNLSSQNEKFQILDIAEKCANFARQKAKAKNVKLETTFGDTSCIAELDKGICAQIMINLLCNAIKSSNAGQTVTFNVKCHEEYFEIIVHDNGAEMDHDVLDEELRGSKTGSRVNLSNTGASLPMVQKLTEMQDGIIYIESKKGSGTTVKVELPFS
ncbi:PAS domain-containing sensor histidine kinase [Pseudemcibacter aquimaris]|uniref:PAS domain-containing sensor histidine kinase n=1 Tax=Pseudemcibacter aquimaris TaxID=2857064 RepID=UPI002010D8E0|nr:PAS domain-containing sensor histidine kinase [Pseudemcibacter aquimaris]MCC3861285.1 PAS domain-containing sensor histidine kinase [Pseudemcibacter aquimaris]WDU58059.1 PAS domain-containing sensor histidine kinase [Pseudemcibacter aquimaris]